MWTCEANFLGFWVPWCSMRKVQGVTSTLMRCLFFQFAIPGSCVCDGGRQRFGVQSQVPDWERANVCLGGVLLLLAPCRGPAALPHRWQELPVCSTATSGAHAELLTVRCLACPLFGSMFLFPFLTWFFLVSVILLLYASCSFQNPWAIFIVKFITNSIWNECKFPKSGTSVYCFLDFLFCCGWNCQSHGGFYISTLQSLLWNIYFSRAPFFASERNPFFIIDSFCPVGWAGSGTWAWKLELWLWQGRYQWAAPPAAGRNHLCYQTDLMLSVRVLQEQEGERAGETRGD